MDRSRFTSNLSGTLVPIDGSEISFLPNALPPQNWQMPEKMWPLLIDARAALARLDGIGRTLPDHELLLRPLQRREAIRSSSLEGTYATPQELLLFEINPRETSSPTGRENEWREVLNYARALSEGTLLLADLPLSLRLIRRMHEVLLTGVRGRDRSPGEFRRYQVHVGSDRRYVPPSVVNLTPALQAFEAYLNGESSVDPLVRSFFAHYQFEAIHPFVDGNGRVGRALLSLCVFQWTGLSKPWLYMSPYFERYKDEYIDLLFAVSTHGAWNEWLEFCLRGVIDQCKDAITRCDALLSLRDNFHERLNRFSRAAGPRTHPLVMRLFSTPIVTVSDVVRSFGVTYPTAKSDIAKLVELGILQELTGRRPKAFFAGEIIDIAFRDEWTAEGSPVSEPR